jgi:ubiquinone/menaquinone biosynthesis C-methylase UbiE
METVAKMEKQQNWWEERAADYYETMYITDTVKDYVTGRRAALAVSHLNKGDYFLDLGVGTGTIFDVVIERSGARGFGMDYTRNMLNVAKSKPGNEDAHFLQGNGISLPFADNTFNVVFSVDVMHHIAFEGMDLLDSALAEARRVLRPDGRLVIYEANPYNVYWYYYMAKIGEDNARLIRRGDLKKRLRRQGMKLHENRYMGFVPEFLSDSSLKWFRKVESAVESVPAVDHLCSNYYVVAEKE